MRKDEAIGIIDEYEADFDEIKSVIDDSNLTPSQKLAEIDDIVSAGGEDDNGSDDD